MLVLFRKSGDKEPFAAFYAYDKKSAVSIANAVNVPGSNVRAKIQD